MENSNKGQGYGEFPQICKLLSTLYPELQSYSKTIKQTEGQKEMEWDEEHQQAFEELKDKITSQPVFFLLKREEKFRVETNTLGHIIRGVLS